MPEITMDMRERFERHVMPEPNSGCWLWMGPLDAHGYGNFVPHRRMQFKAHHAALVLAGRERPAPGMHTDHLCRVRCCVNPDHLEVVTPRENARRGLGGQWQRDKTHCAKGHPYAGRNLRLTKEGHRECRACDSLKAKAQKARKKSRPRPFCPKGHSLASHGHVDRIGRLSCKICRGENARLTALSRSRNGG